MIGRSRGWTGCAATGWQRRWDGCGACSLLDWKFVVLSHNTIRGAAGAAVLNAEVLVSLGKLDNSVPRRFRQGRGGDGLSVCEKLVMKFGGTSVEDATAIQRTAGLWPGA